MGNCVTKTKQQSIEQNVPELISDNTSNTITASDTTISDQISNSSNSQTDEELHYPHLQLPNTNENDSDSDENTLSDHDYDEGIIIAFRDIKFDGDYETNVIIKSKTSKVLILGSYDPIIWKFSGNVDSIKKIFIIETQGGIKLRWTVFGQDNMNDTRITGLDNSKMEIIVQDKSAYCLYEQMDSKKIRKSILKNGKFGRNINTIKRQRVVPEKIEI